MSESRDLFKGASENTLRYFRVASWDPRTIPTNSQRGTVAIVILESNTYLMQKMDDGCTTGWIMFGSGGGSPLAQEYVKVFSVGDWVLQGQEFILNVPHNLEDSTPIVTIFDSSEEETECSYHTVSSNIIRLSVPVSPDIRFSGSVRVTKT